MIERGRWPSVLVAFGTPGMVCGSGLRGEAGQSPSVATKTDRIPVTANSGGSYVTVQSLPPSASVLCRLPILIANWNIGRPSRCN
jgi:hypothetical protein